MPFDSDKQQDWYHATGQTFLDDEPSSSRKVKELVETTESFYDELLRQLQ